MGKVRKRLCMRVPLEILTSPSLSFWTKASLSLSKHNQSIQKSSHACITSYSHNKHGTGDANHMQTSSTGKDKGEVVSSLGKSFLVFIRLAILPRGMICLECHLLFSLLVVASLWATQHWKNFSTSCQHCALANRANAFLQQLNHTDVSVYSLQSDCEDFVNPGLEMNANPCSAEPAAIFLNTDKATAEI